MIEDILDELRRRYSAEDLVDVKLTEQERLTIIIKLETIREIEELVKGD